jgi:hypothetical protein
MRKAFVHLGKVPLHGGIQVVAAGKESQQHLHYHEIKQASFASIREEMRQKTGFSNVLFCVTGIDVMPGEELLAGISHLRIGARPDPEDPDSDAFSIQSEDDWQAYLAEYGEFLARVEQLEKEGHSLEEIFGQDYSDSHLFLYPLDGDKFEVKPFLPRS